MHFSYHNTVCSDRYLERVPNGLLTTNF